MLPHARYTKTAMLLHWLIAALMAVNIALILAVDLFPDDWVRPAVDTHKSIGITVLGLVILRLLWRFTHRPPAMPLSYGRLESFAAHAAHGTLYALMILLPLSGWMHDSAWKDAAAHPMPLSYGRLERFAAHAAHGTLYALMILLPLSGWMHDSAWKDAAAHPMHLFALVPWPRIGWIMNIEPATKEMLHDKFGALHIWAGYILYGLFALHVAGALKHQFIDKEPELQRMLP